MAIKKRWGHGRLLKTKKLTVSLAVDDIAFHTKDGKSIQWAIRVALGRLRTLKEQGTDIFELLEYKREKEASELRRRLDESLSAPSTLADAIETDEVTQHE